MFTGHDSWYYVQTVVSIGFSPRPAPRAHSRAFDDTTTDDDATRRRDEMAKKTVKAGMNTSRDGLVDMGTVPGTVKTLVRRMHETANRGIAVGVGDAEGNDADSTRD